MPEPVSDAEFPLIVKIVHPDKILFEGTAKMVFAPGKKGMLGLMPDHTPMFAELIKGEIEIQSQKDEIVAIESGILRVRDNIITILTSQLPATVDKGEQPPV
jgi:F-type H+-transporting ATPase subunit epsilon